MFIKIIYVFGGFFLIQILGEHWLSKKFNIPKRDRRNQLPLHELQRWIEVGLFVAVFALNIVFDYTFGISSISNYFLAYFIVLSSYRAYAEWKYKREEKHYILQCFNVAIFIVLYIVIYLLF